MTNRFDTSQEQQYVHNYIPLPFQEISALGEKANKNFAEGKQAEAELGALGQAIKAAPMYEGHKQAFINEYNAKTKRLVDEAKGDYGSKDFQLKAQNLINEFKSRPEINAFANTLKSYQDWESQVKDPKNAMNLDFTYDRTEDGKSFRQRNVLEEGVYSPTFTQFEDYTERAKKVMGDVKNSGYVKELGLDFSKPVRINNGETEVYSNKEQGYVGVTKGRVGELSNMLAQNYAQTEAGKHHLQSLLGANVTYNDLLTSAQKGNEQAVQTLQAVNKEFADHIFRSNANQIGGQSTDKVSYLQATNRAAAKANDDKELMDNLRPSTVQSLTNNAIQADSTFGNLFDSEVFKFKNGVVTFDPMALLTQPNVKQGFTTGSMGSYQGSGASVNKLTSNEKSELLQKQLIKMTKAVPGFTIEELSKDGKLDATKVSQLATAYNELTKSRSLDLNLAPAVQETESDLANLNWYAVKQVNPSNPERTVENIPLGEDEKIVVVNRRVDNKGKMYNEGYIKNTKTGEEKPVAFRSQSIEKNLVFDALGKIQKISIDNLSSDPNPNAQMTEPITTQYGKNPMEILGEEKIGQGYYIQALADPNKKYNTLYVMRNADNKVVSMKQSLGELKKDVENFYFTQIPEGRTELELLKSKKIKAENQGNAR